MKKFDLISWSVYCETNMDKILVVEDDSSLNGIYEKRLKTAGYDVKVSPDGESALKDVKDFKPDAIILDLLIPKVDGFTVLANLKKDSSTRGIPVIIASNLGQSEDVNRGMKMGAADFLIKSNVSLAELIDKVKSVIKK